MRNAAIGGAVGGTLLLFGLLACVFLWRRKKLRTSLALFSRQPKSRTALLAEEFDEHDDLPPGARGPRAEMGMRRYSDHPSMSFTHGSTSSFASSPMPDLSGNHPSPYGQLPRSLVYGGPPSPSGAPRLMRSRASETGSVFHEEVWPPPGENSRLVDPLIAGSSAIDLQAVVADVMGPGAAPSGTPAHTREHTRGSSVSSVGSLSGLIPAGAKRSSPLASPTGASAGPVVGSSPRVLWLDRKDARRSADMSGISIGK